MEKESDPVDAHLRRLNRILDDWNEKEPSITITNIVEHPKPTSIFPKNRALKALMAGTIVLGALVKLVWELWKGP